MNRHISTIIVGAGPGGSTCGYILTRAGHECLIVDKMTFPRDKTCGGGLTPKAHKLIDTIFKNIRYNYLPVHKMEFCMDKKMFVRFHLNIEIRNVVRKDFDRILLDEYIEAGGEFLTARIVKIEEKEDKIYLTLDNDDTLSCDTLVGADGSNSYVRKYLQPHFPKTLLMMEKKNSDTSVRDIIIHFNKKYNYGYTYIFPNLKGTIIGYGHLNATIKEFDDEIGRFGLNPQGKTKGAYIPVFEKFEYPFKKNILLIGDAGGYVDSVTGEGIYYAVKTGQNAAVSILEGRDFKDVNEDIIRRVKKLNRIAHIFYNRIFQRLFCRICSLKFLYPFLNKIANYYVAR